MKTLFLAVQFIAGVLMTFAVAAAQQPTAVEQPFQASATIPAGNREIVERFMRSQVNYGSVRILRNGEMVDLDATPGRLTFDAGFEHAKVVDRMTLVMKYYIKNCNRFGVEVSAEETYSFLVELQARYQVGTGVLDPKGSVIGTDLRNVLSAPFHLQKVGDVWAIPNEGYQFTLDWFRPDNSVMVGIPLRGAQAMDLCLFDEGYGVRRYREEAFTVQDELILVSSLQLACEVNMREGTRAWLTLWYDETSGSRVNYDLRTGEQIPWGHDKVPKLGIVPGRYPGSVFVTLANLEVGQAYTIVSATEVTDTKTNVVGTVRADDYTGEPVLFPTSSGDSSQFFGVRPATPDELIGARKTSSLKGN